jgi:hypothetical protein
MASSGVAYPGPLAAWQHAFPLAAAAAAAAAAVSTAAAPAIFSAGRLPEPVRCCCALRSRAATCRSGELASAAASGSRTAAGPGVGREWGDGEAKLLTHSPRPRTTRTGQEGEDDTAWCGGVGRGCGFCEASRRWQARLIIAFPAETWRHEVCRLRAAIRAEEAEHADRGGGREPGPHGVAGARCRGIWTIMRAGGIQPASAWAWPRLGRTRTDGRTTHAARTGNGTESEAGGNDTPRDATPCAMCWHNTSTQPLASTASSSPPPFHCPVLA